MIKQPKFAEYGYKLGIKKLLLIIISIGMLVMPQDLLHFLAVMAHTLYESIVFVMESVLVHVVGISKFQAQIIVFYASFAMAVLAAIVVIRRIPQMAADAKAWAIQSYTDSLNTWLNFSTRRKIMLMMVQFAIIFSMMAFLIS